MNISTNNKEIEFAGKVAIVTGGGRGIGRAIACALSSVGAAVSVMARSEDQVMATVAKINDQGGRAIGLSGDVSKRKDVEHLVKDTERILGPVDILINNAGRACAVGPIWKVDPEEWWNDVTVNLKGTFLCTHTVLPNMISRHKGRIINIVSRFGIRQNPGIPPSPFISGYSASKAGAMLFTDQVAESVREFGIHVFGLVPGLVRTKMIKRLIQSPEGQKWVPYIQTLLDNDQDMPLEKAADLSLLLASGKVDELSGCLIGVDHDIESLLTSAEKIQKEGLHRLRYIE